jgi:hypothetical protein
MPSEYGKLICPNCGNDSSSKKGISYAYLEWRCHVIKGVDGEVIVMSSHSENGDVGWGGDRATVTNVPDDQTDCSHFSCGACQWNWWENKEKDFR